MKKALIILIFIALAKFCHKETDGFALWKILPPEKSEGHAEVPYLQPLKQPYRYLGKGAQVFAFVSEDGQYVLKFFRHHRTRHVLHAFGKIIPAIARGEEKRRARLTKDMQAYHLAEKNLKEETAILALHFGTGKKKWPLTLYDKIGVRHELSLEKTDFILQKRAVPFYEQMDEWLEKGEWIEAKNGLKELVLLLKKRQEKGLSDKDPDLRTNFGFVRGKVVEFDPGRLREGHREDPEEIVRITDQLEVWLQEKAPPMADYLRGIR